MNSRVCAWTLVIVVHIYYSYAAKPMKLKGKIKEKLPALIGDDHEIIGVEFNQVSRYMLLKLLSQVEEHIKTRIRGGGRPIFTAHFANNVHTRPFIYPEGFGRGQ